MSFTINCTGTNNYQVALYFVDWDSTVRQFSVETFDANTLNMIAPEQVITNFNGGAYLVYSYNKSIKFRIDFVRGANAVLSGIFFDPAPTNIGPVLAAINDQYVYAGQTVQVTAPVMDLQGADLTFSLSNAPAGASINPSSGAFSWVTTNAVAPSTNLITVQVKDNGVPPLSGTQSFSVFVSLLPQFTVATTETNSQVQLQFNTLRGQNYQVQFTDNLTDANWTPLGGVVLGVGSPVTVSDDMSGSPQRFYRLLALPQ